MRKTIAKTIAMFILLINTTAGSKVSSDDNNEGGVYFKDATFESKIHFKHVDGRSGRRYFLETVGSGVDFGDYDNDGLLDIVATNFQNELNALYHNDGNGFFSDLSFVAGMGPSLPYVGWGVDFFDADNDGDKDLFIAYGHIHDQIESLDKSSSYAQLNHMLLNNGKGKFVDVSLSSGDATGLRLKK